MKNHDIVVISKMHSYCKRIESAIYYFSEDMKIFIENMIFQDACLMCILQIGELTNRLSTEFKDKNKDIPWHQIRGIRNLIAHEYDSMELVDIWKTLCHDIPILQEFCETILQQNEQVTRRQKANDLER